MVNEDKTTFFMNNIYCYRTDVKKIILTVIRDENLADDYVQTVFEKAWKGLDSLENREAPFTWIKGIIRNEIRGYLKKKKKSREFLEENDNIEMISDSNLECLEKDILEGFLEKERRAHVIEALKMLDEQSQEIVTLHLVVELPLKQIAEDMNLNYGSTRVFYSRAMNKLRNLFLDIEKGVL
ncbi:MAG: RNA polymerase sigma factor [Firmicutes bacterium]|nr:RNA polymerase sigma factor [Bacillota bacterium]